MVTNLNLTSFFLRVGLAIVFLYAAVASFLDPTSWIGFIPEWLREIFPAQVFLVVYSIYEIFLALWLFSGKKTYYAAVLSGLTMLAIIVFNMGALDIVFRDVAILFMAIALAVLAKNH